MRDGVADRLCGHGPLRRRLLPVAGQIPLHHTPGAFSVCVGVCDHAAAVGTVGVPLPYGGDTRHRQQPHLHGDRHHRAGQKQAGEWYIYIHTGGWCIRGTHR